MEFCFRIALSKVLTRDLDCSLACLGEVFEKLKDLGIKCRCERGAFQDVSDRLVFFRSPS